MKQDLGFADFALASSMKHNRSLKNMEKLDKAIDWSRVDAILMNHYTTRPVKIGFLCQPYYHCISSQRYS